MNIKNKLILFPVCVIVARGIQLSLLPLFNFHCTGARIEYTEIIIDFSFSVILLWYHQFVIINVAQKIAFFY